MEPLPYQVIEAIIQVFGRSFHYKDVMSSFLLSSGVKKPLVEKYRNEYKYVWARKLLTELGETEEGCLTQRKILTNLCKLRNLPDPDVPDRTAGLDALRNLKQIAQELQLEVIKEKEEVINRRAIKQQEQKLRNERAQKLEVLRTSFFNNLTSKSRQEAGYSLEDLLKDLFALFEIEYRPSYRTETQQIDGHFKFEGFDYLVEARWRKDIPDEDEIGGFERKVNTKLESTRGLFISVQGFRENVVQQFNGKGASIIFMCGRDLTLILEGHFDLSDALRAKIECAAQKGIVYYPLNF
ncbi:MAG: restriction endonuclease [Syntrophomonadaceae bacterium]|nr:restriction endonuclease [Syntrophomonadaceae bacterium]